MKLLFSLAVVLSFIGCNEREPLHYCPSQTICVINNQDKIQFVERDSLGYTILNQGVCQTGERVCLPENVVECRGYIGPSEEVCDGADNDCDGEIDELFDQDGDLYTTCNYDCDDNNSTVHPSAQV